MTTEFENHTENGQFRTDSPEKPENHTDSDQLRTDLTSEKCENHTGNGQFWTESPEKIKNHTENGQFYTDSTSGNGGSGCPKGSEPELSTPPAQTASLSAKALLAKADQLSPPSTQLPEWLLYQQLLESASVAAEQLKKHPKRVTLTQLAKLYELASTLGRRALGLPLETPVEKSKPPKPAPGDLTIEEKLERIYGSKENEF